MAPKHLLIREQLLAEISAMHRDDALPQERELAERFDVSRTTVRQALRGLAEDGLIYSIRGMGTFVSGGRISKGLKLTSFSEDMRGRDMEPSSRVLSATEMIATNEVALKLELAPKSAVFAIERLRLADGVPMCRETIYLPAHLFPHLLQFDLSSSLYKLMAEQFRVRVENATQRVSSALISGADADLLGVPHRAPALVVSRQGVDGKGRLVEYAVSIYRGDRYDYSFTVQR
ncbi:MULTISPECIES: GntR family transcriptional regulator [unclassified Cryobacterium]|uniref:GntR family transcriptional regulator n=1 Tax=unclassified Cryobacterium TaxID=2649013 RepID=UPI00106D08C3|nr:MULTISPECIES: GntR family transcriptional regulator [unclassified Cryobacterium]TFD07820.1 GntR family transcriptional regulator [Cryobacterium sp. TMT1-66-1]TFD07895.1 GntR family transcriptional regulator [Cryobacterium sp. TMT1-2-2]